MVADITTIVESEAETAFIEEMECQNCMCQRWETEKIPLSAEYRYFATGDVEVGPPTFANAPVMNEVHTKEWRPVRYALRCGDCGYEQEFGTKAQEVILVISRDPRHHWHWEMDRIHSLGLNETGELGYSQQNLTITLDHQQWFFMHTRSDSWRGLNFTSYECRDCDIPQRLKYQIEARLRK